MKKLFYLLLCALPLISISACSDDNDLPDVNFSFDITGGKFYEGSIYAVKGQDLSIDAIKVINNEQGKLAFIPYADYYINYVFYGRSVVSPFGIKIPISAEPKSDKFFLQIYAPLYAVDKSTAYTMLGYTVNIVDSEEDLPQGTESLTFTPPITDKDPSK